MPGNKHTLFGEHKEAGYLRMYKISKDCDPSWTKKMRLHESRRSSPLRAPRRSPSTAVGVRTPCPLRRSLLAFGIEPGQPRDAHARHANARARRSQVDGAARNSQRHMSVVSQRRVGRRTAVGRSGSCATRRGTGRDPGPCSPCTAAVSRAVDARVHTELGSHAKPGLHMRRLPLQACDGASSHMASCALTKGAACSIRSNRFDADKHRPQGSHLPPVMPVSIGCSVASADRNRSLFMTRRVVRLNAGGRIDRTTTYVPRVMPMRLGRTFNRRKDNELRGKSKTPPQYQSRLGLNPT